MNTRLPVFLTKVARAIRGSHAHDGHYHDVAGPSSLHFEIRLKRGWRNRFKKASADERRRFIAEMRERGEDVSAFEADPRERLVQFLRDFGQRRFGPSAALESLTLLEDMTDSGTRGGGISGRVQRRDENGVDGSSERRRRGFF